MNRFVKNNILLILVISLSLIAACVLLVWIVMEHSRMSSYIQETDTLRKKISQLIQKTPAPVEDNKAPIAFNTELYTKAARALEKQFGHPKKDALDKFIDTIRLREPRDGKDTITLAQFRKEFMEGWGDGTMSSAQQGLFYKEFQRKFRNWGEAMKKFSEMVAKVTMEPISEFTIDDIFRSALGVGRTLPDHGGSEIISRFVMDYRNKLLESLSGKVTVSPQAANFSFDSAGFAAPAAQADMGMRGMMGFGGGPAAAAPAGVTAADYTLIASHLDVIGDITQRLGKSGVKELLMFRKRALAGETVGGYQVFHYSFEVVGPMQSIRDLVRLLDEGFIDNRLYVVRSVFLYAMSDPARELFEPEAIAANNDARQQQQMQNATMGRRRRRGGDPGQVMPPQMQMGGPDGGMMMMMPGGEMESEEEVRAREAAELKARIEYEKKLEPHQRTGYGKVIIGGDDNVRALIDVEYVMQNTAK